MANRFPLIVDTSDSNKIKEIPSGDSLQLSGNSIIGVVDITGSGTLTIGSISATTITKGGTPLATVATSGSYDDLSDKPTNISLFTNDANYIVTGSNVSNLNNDSGYLTTVAFGDLTGKPTTLSGYGITDAATSAQGTTADSALQPGSNISTLNNDSGYITLTQVQNGDLTIDVKNSGDLIGSVFGQDSTILVDAILSSVNVSGTIRGHVLPRAGAGGLYDIGSAEDQFKDIHLSGRLNGNVNGNLDGEVTGSVFADDSTLLVDGVSGTIPASVVSGRITNDILTSSLAVTGYALLADDVDVSGRVAVAGDITATGNSTIGGNLSVSGNLSVTGNTDLKGSIFADDSTLLVDGVNGEIPGYVKIADLKTALQDGAGDYAAFKAWVLANL